MQRQLAKISWCDVVLIALFLPWLALLPGCSSKSIQKNFNLATAIPTGEKTVEVLTVRYSDRVEELAQKMSSTVSSNQEWWVEFIKQHADDRPLPYNTNFGLTKQEYAEFLDGGKKTRQLKKVSDALVTFTHEGDFVTVDVGDTNSTVGKWLLNTETLEVRLPTGEVIKPEWHSNTDATQPIGVSEGYVWHFEPTNAEPSDIRTASLEIFRLKPSGMIFWRINEGEIQNKRIIRSLDVAFRYAPKIPKD